MVHALSGDGMAMSGSGIGLGVAARGAFHGSRAGELSAWTVDWALDALFARAEDSSAAGPFGGPPGAGTAPYLVPVDPALLLVADEANRGWLLGGSGNDTLLGNDGPAYAFGFGGADLLLGGTSHVLLAGGDADDTLLGGAGDDLLHGEAGDDRLVGGAGNDWLDGGAGDDLLLGGAGADAFRFGPDGGRDVAFAGAEDSVLIDAGAGGLRAQGAGAGRVLFTMVDPWGAAFGSVLLLAETVARLELRASLFLDIAPDAVLHAETLLLPGWHPAAQMAGAVSVSATGSTGVRAVSSSSTATVVTVVAVDETSRDAGDTTVAGEGGVVFTRTTLSLPSGADLILA